MSEEVSSDKKRVEAKLEERVQIEPVDLPVNVQSSDPPPPIPSSSLAAGSSTHNGVNGVHGGESSNGRDDSEAETVVLSGKDESRSEGRRKAIKQEIMDDIEPERESKMVRHEGSDKRQKSEDENGRRASLKRKRGRESDDVGIVPADWNTLSPALSSPAYGAQSPRSSNSVFDRFRSPPGDEATPKKGRPRRKPRQDQYGDDQEQQQRGKSDPSSEKRIVKERRETRSSITQHEVPSHRSESPPERTHKRAQSIQSNTSEPHGVKRRKVPQPLIIDQRRKPSDDAHGDSDDSSSVYSRPSLQKLTSTDTNPLVKVSKKNRDKNGRTLLARACALDEVEAEMRLKERPEDLDIPDNAGNTPLQIASLEGKAKIVHLLLEAGCDINCKNIDMETPLIDAVENGHVDVVRLLLKAGLDPRQSNAKGEEPLDLVNPENDHYDAIRAALITAKEKANPRRFSEERTFHRQRDHRFSNAASGASPTDPLPLHTSLHPSHTSLHPAISPLHNSLDSAKSPPPGARRRTARSQPTRDGLLWVTATPENLRDAAGKGDLTVVDHILKMRPVAGNESVLAASRGGHELVVELLIAIGKPDPDPDPIRSSDYVPAYSTPMLAAIGRGNVEVLKLLLNQPGFDPTRRLYRNLAYHELAKERKSTVWQEEYRILKEAYDNYTKHRAKRTNHGSPQRMKAKKTSELTSHKSNSDTSSPISGKSKNSHSSSWEPKEDGRRDSKSSPSTGWESREDSKRDLKNSHSIGWEHKEEIRRESKYAQSGAWEPKGKEEYKRDIRTSHSTIKEDTKRDSAQLPHSHLRADQENRDRGSDTLANRHKPKGMRSASDAGQPGIHKKRKLFNRNSLKDTARDTTRNTLKDTTKGSSKNPTKDSTRDTMNTVKRRASLAEATAHKKRRLGTEPLTLESPQLQHRPAKIANMISPDSTTSPTVAPAAPIAFMGSGSSPVLQSPIRQSTSHQPSVSKSGLDKKDDKNTPRSKERVQPLKETRKRDLSPKEARKRDLSPKEARKRDLSPREFRKREPSPKDLQKLDLSAKEARKRHRADAEADENRRIAREEEESRRQAQETEKKRKDEELQRKRAEYERIRKEEAERLRDQEREKLLKEEQERIRKAEEAERARKEKERLRKEEEERLRLEEEEKSRKQEEERRLKEEKSRKQEEERRLKEEKSRKQEEERRLKEEKSRKQEEERRLKEEKIRKQEEERRLKEEKSRKQEEERRLKEEAEKALREEEERRQKEEQERLRKEEEERIRKEKEEKLRKDEEDRRLKEEEEQRLKQEQEAKRLQAQLEERERQRVLAEEQERKRREALPNGLRRAAELSPEQAKERKEIVKWLPLHTVTTYDLDPDCENRVAEERWIANVQVSPILAITDLNLSQYSSWQRLPATQPQRLSLWRQCRNQMSQALRSPLDLDWSDVVPLDSETRPKFLALETVFWIKLQDFLDVVDGYAHLSGLKMRTRAMIMNHEFVFNIVPPPPSLPLMEEEEKEQVLTNGVFSGSPEVIKEFSLGIAVADISTTTMTNGVKHEGEGSPR